MRTIILAITIMLSCFAYSNEWTSNYDDWTCYGKMGVIEEQYSIDSYTDNVEADDRSEYNLLCKFTNNIKLNDEYYAFNILFPNCDFTTSNQLLTVKLYKYEKNNALTILNEKNLKLSFPPNSSYFTGEEINRDQNVKAAFILNVIAQQNLNINIDGIGEVSVNLEGLQKGIQNPSCVANN